MARISAQLRHERPAERCDVSSIQLVVHTGSACPPATKRAMIKWLGPVLVETYGGTEVGSVCKMDSTEWLARPAARSPRSAAR